MGRVFQNTQKSKGATGGDKSKTEKASYFYSLVRLKFFKKIVQSWQSS